MKQIYTQIDINADPSDVWNVLINLPNHHTWNPSIIQANGSVEEGKFFQGIVRLPFVWPKKWQIKTLRLIANKEWISSSRLWEIPDLLDVEYCLRLVSIGANKTRLILRGHYCGLFSHGILFEKILKASCAFQQTLKHAVENSTPLDCQCDRVACFGDYDPAALERLKGSWALVTGGSSGIGREFGFQLAQAGMDIVLVARNKEALEKTAQEIRQLSHREIVVVSADVGDTLSCEALRKELIDRGIQIRVLVNAAGFDYWDYFDDMSAEICRNLLRVNAQASMELCHLFREDLSSHLTGVVIHIASSAVLTPVPYMTVYTAAKSFVFQFSQSLYGEWLKRGVLVQTLLPGSTQTKSASLSGLLSNKIIDKAIMPREVVSCSLEHLKHRLAVVATNRRPLLHIIFVAIFPIKVVILAIAQCFYPPVKNVGQNRQSFLFLQ